MNSNMPFHEIIELIFGLSHQRRTATRCMVTAFAADDKRFRFNGRLNLYIKYNMAACLSFSPSVSEDAAGVRVTVTRA